MGDTLTQAFTTAITTIKTDSLSLIGVVVPPALSIAGIGIAIRLAVSLFKRMAG